MVWNSCACRGAFPASRVCAVVSPAENWQLSDNPGPCPNNPRPRLRLWMRMSDHAKQVHIRAYTYRSGNSERNLSIACLENAIKRCSPLQDRNVVRTASAHCKSWLILTAVGLILSIGRGKSVWTGRSERTRVVQMSPGSSSESGKSRVLSHPAKARPRPLQRSCYEQEHSYTRISRGLH